MALVRWDPNLSLLRIFLVGFKRRLSSVGKQGTMPSCAFWGLFQKEDQNSLTFGNGHFSEGLFRGQMVFPLVGGVV